jgi:hypothetical protein
MPRATCLFLTATLLGVVGCASSQTDTTVPVPREDVVRVTTGDGSAADVRLQREDFIVRSEVNAARAAVWEAIPAVFAEIGLPAPVMDRASWIAAVEDHTIMRFLGKEALSRLISCGSGMSGEYANTRRIRLTVRTLLENPSPDRTIVSTRVEARAYAMDGTSTAPAECASRGPLEAMIRDGLRRRVSTGPGTM